MQFYTPTCTFCKQPILPGQMWRYAKRYAATNILEESKLRAHTACAHAVLQAAIKRLDTAPGSDDDG